MKIVLKVYRYNPDTNRGAYYDTFRVPFTRGMRLLDGLNYIQQRLDKTLAFRWECRSKICGTCGIMLNKVPVLSCGATLDGRRRENIVEPLANFPVEKDLIVNLKQVLEKYKRVRPYLEKIRDIKVTKSEADKSKPFRRCIECGCCIAGSSTISQDPYATLDPMALVKIARYVTDPRDGLDRRTIAKQEGVMKYTASEGKCLTKICSRGVPIDQAIQLLKE